MALALAHRHLDTADILLGSKAYREDAEAVEDARAWARKMRREEL